MERAEAVQRLKGLEGQELHALAARYAVATQTEKGKVNKGWAGHVFERYLGLPLNSAQSPNFGSWELKSIPLRHLRNGRLVCKETMAITMIDPWQVARTPFAESHLLSKLHKVVLVARTVGKTWYEPSYVHTVAEIILTGAMYAAVQEDYEAIRACINDPARGFAALAGSMGTYIQPRTKGPGHGSTSRAFYARKGFLAHFLGI